VLLVISIDSWRSVVFVRFVSVNGRQVHVREEKVTQVHERPGAEVQRSGETARCAARDCEKSGRNHTQQHLPNDECTRLAFRTPSCTLHALCHHSGWPASSHRRLYPTNTQANTQRVVTNKTDHRLLESLNNASKRAHSTQNHLRTQCSPVCVPGWNTPPQLWRARACTCRVRETARQYASMT
jgi:hypothetical protein